MTPLLETVTLVCATVIAGLLMGFLHYLIPELLGRDLAPPWSYVIGVGLGIALPFAGWCLLYGALIGSAIPADLVVVAFFCVTAGAGFVTLFCYDVDKRKKKERENEKAKRLLDDALK